MRAGGGGSCFWNRHFIGGGAVPFPCVHALAEDGGGRFCESQRHITVFVANGHAIFKGDVGGHQVRKDGVFVADRRANAEVGDARGFDRETRLDRGRGVGGVAEWIVG